MTPRLPACLLKMHRLVGWGGGGDWGGDSYREELLAVTTRPLQVAFTLTDIHLDAGNKLICKHTKTSVSPFLSKGGGVMGDKG